MFVLTAITCASHAAETSDSLSLALQHIWAFLSVFYFTMPLLQAEMPLQVVGDHMPLVVI